MSAPTLSFTKLAYRLRTPRLVLRCMEPEDAVRRQQAVDSSGAHLQSFFPPTPEGPITLEGHAAMVRRARGNFDTDQDRAYGVFDPDSGRMWGETFLLKRAGLEALEVGYWLAQEATGRGIATEAASAMVKVAFEFDGVMRVDLMCKPENHKSAAVARRLGFTLEGRLRERRLALHHERGDLLCFTLLAAEYPQTAASQLPLERFDFLGRKQE